MKGRPIILGMYMLFVATALMLFIDTAHAQELVPDEVIIAKAEVIEVLSSETALIPGTTKEHTIQTIRVRVLDGPEEGLEVLVDNDYLMLSKGDIFYLTHTKSSFDGRDYYAVGEPYRLPWLLGLGVLFIFLVVLLGGWQGTRGLVSLAASLLFIGFLLLPGILEGYSPLLVAIGTASLITILGSYITHGFTRTTTTAVLGMVVTIVLTGGLAYLAVYLTQLSGFSSDEAVYLNFGTSGSIDFVGLLLGGIMIGLLGVLYDAAIGQSVAIEELYRAGPHLHYWDIFSRALRIGREHIGALVNTLAIAYVGASLPLFLLFYSAGVDFWITINKEVFAAEIVRILVGSIGVVLVVPITTLFATFLLHGQKPKAGREPHAHS